MSVIYTFVADIELWFLKANVMKGLENQVFLVAYIISNIVSLILLIFAIKHPKIARLLFALLFGWACWINWQLSITTPQVYVEYADLAMLDVYKQFIQGWFSRHVLQAVGFIATCQGLIAIGLLFRGWVYKVACLGAIAFLLAIMPLGVGAAFPCTFIMAVGVALLLRSQQTWIWQTEKQPGAYTVAMH